MRPTKPLPFAQPAISGGKNQEAVEGRLVERVHVLDGVSRLKTAQGNPNVLRHLTLGEAGLVLRKNYQQNHRLKKNFLKSR